MKKWISSLVLVAALSAFSAIAGAQIDGAVSIPAASDIRDYLKRCPDWERVPNDEIEMRESITRIYFKMAQFSSAAVRAGIESFMRENAGGTDSTLEASSKVYAFYRVFFKINDGFYPPDTEDEASSHNVQSILGTPLQGIVNLNLLWPYSIDNSGNLRLNYVEFMGERTRSGYFPLRDYDVLMKRFGRRIAEAYTLGPNHPSDPTLSSVTSSAGQPTRLP